MKLIKAVEREHASVRFATDYLLIAARQDISILSHEIRVRDIEESVKQLEGTYIIRLFAEFETSLRAFWISSRQKDPPSRARDLLDGVGAKRRIPTDTISNAHAVRDFRNSLVHEREELVNELPIAIARSHLCSFLAFLPLEF
jgi:hypothetical protein